MALKATVLKLHFKSRKHKDGKERPGRKGKRDMDIAESFLPCVLCFCSLQFCNNKRIIGKSSGIIWKLKRIIGEVLGNRGIE